MSVSSSVFQSHTLFLAFLSTLAFNRSCTATMSPLKEALMSAVSPSYTHIVGGRGAMQTVSLNEVYEEEHIKKGVNEKRTTNG